MQRAPPVSDESERRQHARVMVGLLVRVKAQDVEQFIESYATNISTGGIFIQSRKLYPKGTLLKFEVQLKSGQPVLRGRGLVVWKREPALPGAKPQVPGMGVKFLQLDPRSAELVKRMVQLKSRRGRPKPAAPAPKPAAKPPPPESAEDLDLEIEAPADVVEPSVQVEGLKAESYEKPQDAGLEIDVDLDLEVDVDLDADERAPAAAPGGPSVNGGASSRVIGIDLGTTNSCASVVVDGRPRVIPSRKGYRTIPSIVAYDDRGRLLVGHAAKEQMELNPTNTVYGSKRLIGRPYHSPAVRQIRDRFHYEIIEGPRHEAAVRIVGRPFSLQQVAAFLLTEIRDIARELLGEEVGRAVITVPAYYNENQRQAVREAGTLAGLQVERIVNEPTAAALAFGHDRQLDQRVLVYDLGGGTFDASALELTDNVYEVVATGGDAFLGGVDFDNQLVDHLLQAFVQSIGRVPELDRPAMQRLRDAAEMAKCGLSEKSETIVRLPFFAAVDNTPKDLEVRVARSELEALVAPLVERTLDVAQAVLRRAGWRAEQLDNVLLVGGQSRMPYIWRRIREVFGRDPHKGVHPDEAVAVGAALLADSVDRIDSVVLIDVLPMSIGLGLPGGAFLAVLQAGTSLPATKSYQFSNFLPDQTEIELLVFQGESERVVDNEYLGTLHVSGIPPAPKGAVRMEMTFSLDQECLLKVSARDLTNSQPLEAKLVGGETDATIRQKLKIPDSEQPRGQSVPEAVTAPAAPPAAEADPETAAEQGGRRREGLLGRWLGRKGERKD
jgi:molecular chaperone DnaK